MIDLTQKYLPQLRDHKIVNLDLGKDTLHPAYQNQSLLNVPSSLCEWFNAQELPHPALKLEQLNDLAEDVEQIVIILIDAISLTRFQRWMEKLEPEFISFLQDAYLFPLTSIVPSTTCSVLTTLWTGRSPAEHGILGYELFLREYGLIANMITLSPASFEGRSGLLYQAGYQPETALPVPTLGTYLSQAGVESFALLSSNIQNSGLSRMHYTSVDTYGFRTQTDLWIQARHLAQMRATRPRLIWIYYGAVDGYSHHFGPDSEQAEAEFVSLLNTLFRIFLSKYQSDTRRKTLLMILSDHGQLYTPKNPHYELSNHPDLINRLHMFPTGENRLAYLYPRPGEAEAVQEYIAHTWPGKFKTLPSSDALKNGLFGPGEINKEARSRIGDYIVVSQEDAYMWWSHKPNPLLGRHGGLSEEEMVVPLLAVRLG
jgi:predicted AlkP superfamily pyrophosphatase or phosphodiesterase